MAHASNVTTTLPDVPARIRERYVPYHDDFDIEAYLQSLELRRPGFLDAMVRMLDVLAAQSVISETSVDVDEEDFLRPVTLWAESTFPMEEREEQLLRFHHLADDTLKGFADLVLVAVV